MIHVPDGREVVATGADAENLEMPPLLIVDRVAQFLDSHGIGEGELSWQRIGDGQSNITYLIKRSSTQVVIRRGPRPPLPKSTHDMMREARVQRGLSTVSAPVPRILAVCEDEGILGVPFYVMEYLRGEIIIDHTPSIFDDEARRRHASERLVDSLAELHRVDLLQTGLESFGRPAGYLERQVATFTRLSSQVSERSLPAIGELAEWLAGNIPETQAHTIVHGDYRFGNVMFATEPCPRVLAILDWEMAALGDPLADLGYLTATYSDASSAGTVMEITTATREPGYLTSEQLAERYAAHTGFDVSDLPWYQTLALWKSSVFLEAIYGRWKRGERPGDEFAQTLEAEVPKVLEAALQLAR